MCTLSHDKRCRETVITGEANPHLKIRLCHDEDHLSIREWYREHDISRIDVGASQRLAGHWMHEMASVMSTVHDATGFAHECGQALLVHCSDRSIVVSFVALLPESAAAANEDEASSMEDEDDEDEESEQSSIEDWSSSDVDSAFPSDEYEYFMYYTE
jgi:hypothetical protein